MCVAADKIKTNLLTHPGVNQKSLAEYLSLSEKTLSFQLNHSKQLRNDIKDGANQYFKIHGVELILDDNKECNALMKAVGFLLKDKTSEMNLEQFYNEVLKAVEDNVLSESEKCKLITVIERLRILIKNQNELRMNRMGLPISWKSFFSCLSVSHTKKMTNCTYLPVVFG